MVDVITIGSALQDVFLEVAAGKKITGKNIGGPNSYLGFALDSKVSVAACHRHLGGGGINTAVVFQNLGLNPLPISSVGDDSWGRGVKDNLRQLDIDTAAIISRPNTPTGLSVLLHDVGAKEHLSFNYKGASDNLQLAERHLPAAKWAYITSLTGSDWEEDMASVTDLAANTTVAWNPGNNQLKAIGNLEEMLRQTEVLLVNFDEAKLLLHGLGLDPRADKRRMFTMLADLGPRVIVVTEGVAGANVFAESIWYQAPIMKFDAVDATGAGDTFGATFVAGLILKKDYTEALKMAIINAGAVTRNWGAQRGLMTLAEISAHLPAIAVKQL
jgi:sugar/nucleoside kinase (ribokinase family)